MTAGTTVGDVARSILGWRLIDTESLGQALDATQEALKTRSCPIFEATFQHQGVLVRADGRLPDTDGYRMAAKSSTGVKDYRLADAAVQAWVARGAGIDLSSVEIAHIDRSFVYPGGNDYRGLLHHADITEQIRPLRKVPNWVGAAQATLAGDEPAISPGDQCHEPFDCPFIGYARPQWRSPTQ